MNKRNYYILHLLFFCLVLSAQPAHAYIGPGAGIAFFSSFFIFFVTFLIAFLILLLWPLRYVYLKWKRRKIIKRLQQRAGIKTKRAIIIGLDGLDPKLAEEFMNKGLLPNFVKLRQMGSFTSLGSTCPSISPVAWSSFSTGVSPARHGIYDFFTRDRRSYLPVLSSVFIGNAKRSFNIGKYKIPLGQPEIKFLRKSTSFWKVLSQMDVPCSIIRVPITFPPEKFSGRLLSAMCVPDLKGTQGSFSFYSDNKDLLEKKTGGEGIYVELHDTTFTSSIIGPPNSLLKKPEPTKIDFKIRLLNSQEKSCILSLQNSEITLHEGRYSEWLQLCFKLGLRQKVYGICRFYPMSLAPGDIRLYLSPINIDPHYPVLPISTPSIYSNYLSQIVGPYATLGLAEDTWALNEGILDDDAFLDQCYRNHEERERMLFHELNKTGEGVCACVFDTTDRIQHMFWRYHDTDHPALRGKDKTKHAKVLEELYVRMDTLLGRVLNEMDKEDLLMVMSDHGFTSFRRCVNLNTWLFQNNYLALKSDADGGEWLSNIDWDNTRAFALGLTGIFINQKGREIHGIVAKGAEKDALKKEIIQKLSGLRDEEENKTAINAVYDAQTMNRGPYNTIGPDLIIGYNSGYRASWESATGKLTNEVISDNSKNWSGDHCIDYKLVPGVLFCNRKIQKKDAHIIDIAPTLIHEFGLEIPPYIEGGKLFS
ncbi:MAG: alkaline phosphatase family protein [bacterium]